MKPMKPRAGDWVTVKSKEEILRTLDKDGRLEGLPFMPQMFQYCGKRMRVFKRAHKTCDTVAGPKTGYVGRRLPDGVHLDLRCDGKACDGCQAGCLLFWKEAWLDQSEAPTGASLAEGSASAGCTEDDVWKATRRVDAATHETRYVCQATELHDYTEPLKWWDARQYVEDYRSGNTSLVQMLRVLVYAVFYYGSLAHRNETGAPRAVALRRVHEDRGRKPNETRARQDTGWGPYTCRQPQPRCRRLGPCQIIRRDP